MIERIDHTALVVSDMARSIDFYTGTLGFRIVKELDFPGRKLVMIALGDDPASKIELIRYDETDLSDPSSRGAHSPGAAPPRSPCR